MAYLPTYDPRGYVPLDDRWLPCIRAYNPDEAQAICDTYDEGCAIIGYDSNAAIAQGCVETGYFTSNRWKESHNAAGIGIYADDTPDVIWLYTEDTPHGTVEDGVHGQLDLLTDYFTDGSEPFGTLAPLGFGGMEKGFSELCQMDGVWAADEGYSEAIVGVMNEVIPDNGGAPVTVSADDVVAMGQTQIGHAYSNGFDTVNGTHQWAYWCLAFADSANRNCGVDVPLYPNAVTAGRARDLQPGPAPKGAACFFDETFYYPDGHVGISMGDGRLLGTLTNPSNVGYMYWNDQTPGYMGWAYYENVEPMPDPRPPDPPPTNWLVQPDNPYSPDDAGNEVGVGGGFKRFYDGVAAGQDPMTVLGYALANEEQAIVTDDDGTSRQRTIQRFERGTLIYQPENAFPYDVVNNLNTQEFAAVPPASDGHDEDGA